jgi:hypothetical protein
MTPAASVSFFRSELNDFLYAPIGEQRNEMPISVLSALARLNVDPWLEATELSKLSTDAAIQRLASLIGRLPGGRWAQTDSRAIAARLIVLLPPAASYGASSAGKSHGPGMIRPPIAIILLCTVLAITAVVFAENREPSSHGDQADLPAFSATSPPLNH